MLTKSHGKGKSLAAGRRFGKRGPATVLAQRFIQRRDVYPLQLEDGRYICLHEQLNVSRLYAHLRGVIP